jgi:hypothetical protein
VKPEAAKVVGHLSERVVGLVKAQHFGQQGAHPSTSV